MVFGFSSSSASAAAAAAPSKADPAVGGKNFHVPESDETSTDLYCPLPIPLPWRMTGANWITEAQTYYLLDAKSGNFLFIQLAWSNLSWPASTTCQLSSRLYRSGGKPTSPFTVLQERVSHSSHNYPASKLKLSEDRLDATLKHLQIEQTGHLQAAGGRLSLGEGGEGGQGRQHAFNCNLRVKALTDSFQCHDGSVHFGINRRDGHVNLRFQPALLATGTFKAMAGGEDAQFGGLGMCLHQFQGVKPYLSASRWNMFYFCADNADQTCLYMIQMTTPKIYQRQTHSVGYLFHRGQMRAITRTNTIEPSGAMARDPESGYLLPTSLHYRWRGITLAPCQSFQADCQVTFNHLVAKIGVLDTLPFVIRKVVEAFVAKPFVYQWLEHTTVEIQLGEEREKLTGWSFHEISLISEEADSEPAK